MLFNLLVFRGSGLVFIGNINRLFIYKEQHSKWYYTEHTRNPSTVSPYATKYTCMPMTEKHIIKRHTYFFLRLPIDYKQHYLVHCTPNSFLRFFVCLFFAPNVQTPLSTCYRLLPTVNIQARINDKVSPHFFKKRHVIVLAHLKKTYTV